MSDPLNPEPRPRRTLLFVCLLLVLAGMIAVVVVLTRDDNGSPDAESGPTPESSGTPSPTATPTGTVHPGTLLQSKPMTNGVPLGMRAWRITYATTDADGGPTTATGSVLAMEQLPAGPRPVISLGHGTVGIASRCSPSSSDQPFTGANTALAALLQEGWVAVYSDYAGLGGPGPHPYLVGKAEAHNVLDAVRAAHEVLKLSPKTVVWGHSQGGHAALWSGIEAPSYAPDLKLIGVAATAPASDLQGVLSDISDLAAGKLVQAYLVGAWVKIYPQLAGQLSADSRALVDRIGKLCLRGAEALEALDLARRFEPVMHGKAMSGELRRLLRANTPTGHIDAPLLVAQGGGDLLVTPVLQRRWVAERCAAGQSLDYREYAGLTHTSLIAPTSPLMADLVSWAQARLAGEPAQNTCPN